MLSALLLTQYEKYGCVDRSDFVKLYIDEEMEVSEDMIGDYNEFLLDVKNDPDDYIYYDLEEMLYGLSATEIAYKVFYSGNFNPNDDYFKFNGYGNLESLDSFRIVEKMEEDTEFLEWYIEKSSLIDWNYADKIIEECNELIVEGY